MSARVIKTIVATAFVASFGSLATRAGSADQTTTGAMASIGYLAGTWHCTGGGPPEDDTYTIDKNWWHDTDSNGGVTSGTYDAKRQKWVVFVTGSDGTYAVNEGTTSASNPNQLVLTVPYPAGNNKTYTFTKASDTQFTLGPQTCIKK